MRAVVLSEFGPPEVLVATEAPDPVAGPGEVLIDVEVANITFVETQVRAGRPPHPSMLPDLPAILGNGVGGRVAGGDGGRVISSLGGLGGYAERAVAPAARLVPVPDGVELRDAVALLADGRTAVGLMQGAAITPGETVLVPAAAGGVGTLLVQLAAHAGALVVAAARGERKLTLARELGAEVVVDYDDPGWDGALEGVDVAFDGVGGAIGRAAFELVRPGGRFLPFGMASGAFAPVSDEDADARDVRMVRGGRPTPEELVERVGVALTEAESGRLRPVVGQTFPLERAAGAHAAIESRATVGKTLLLT